MPRKRDIKGRCKQILEWMKDCRPCGRDVKLCFVKYTSKENKSLYAQTVRNKNSLCIYMNLVKCSRHDVAIETLIHEYAHCRLWGLAKSELCEKIGDHGPEFWAEYGVIYNLFHYEDGDKESNSY